MKLGARHDRRPRPSKYPAQLVDDARKAYANGHGPKAIAQSIGVNVYTVTGWCRGHNRGPA